ncbi:hypothetical protein GOP47_0029395 [Adiantum capillus-veneris]|nr:hypothetical protein GOP47_0029395 [Adiantum capillus-veneris]
MQTRLLMFCKGPAIPATEPIQGAFINLDLLVASRPGFLGEECNDGAFVRDQGLEWIELVTSSSPRTTFLAGKNSVYRGIPKQVTAAAFNVDEEQLRELGRDEEVFFPPSKRGGRGGRGNGRYKSVSKKESEEQQKRREDEERRRRPEEEEERRRREEEHGENVFDQEVREGTVLVIPQFFPSVKIAGDQGLEWIELVTSSSPRTTFLAGKNSVYRGIPKQVTAAAFNVDEEQLRELGRDEEDPEDGNGYKDGMAALNKPERAQAVVQASIMEEHAGSHD